MAVDGLVPPEEQFPEQALNKIARAAFADFPGAPPLFVLESPNLLQRDAIGVRGVPVAAGAMIGRKMSLFRDGISGAASARRTFWHELFHYGLRRLMTPEAYAATIKNHTTVMAL